MKQTLQIFTIAVIGIFLFQKSVLPQQKIVGYFESWAGLSPDKVEYQNLTHIIHAFAWPDTDGTIGRAYGIPDTSLISLAHQANDKVLVSFTNIDSINGLGKILADSSLRSIFISNLIQFLAANHYDGIDIDWEYPTAAQSSKLTELVKEIRQRFDRINSALLISMAIPPNQYYGQYYEVENLLPYVDWFSILAYNFHGPWSAHSGHNAPLYPSPEDSDGDDSNSVQYMRVIRSIPASKILLGVPFYGLEFNSKGLYKPFTGSVPTLNYSALPDTLSAGKWYYNWDSVSDVPYYIKSDSTKFISIDDTTSIRLKTQFSISENLGGIMIWALGFDKINNSQPLLETIAQTMRDNPSSVVSYKQGNNPVSFYLYDNYPNPFNPSTIISWRLASGSFVTLKVYDTLGNEVATIVNEFQNAGVHSISFNTKQLSGNKDLASGIYMYRLTAGDFVSTKKMMYLK
jgi:chitinase